MEGERYYIYTGIHIAWSVCTYNIITNMFLSITSKSRLKFPENNNTPGDYIYRSIRNFSLITG